MNEAMLLGLWAYLAFGFFGELGPEASESLSPECLRLAWNFLQVTVEALQLLHKGGQALE